MGRCGGFFVLTPGWPPYQQEERMKRLFGKLMSRALSVLLLVGLILLVAVVPVTASGGQAPQIPPDLWSWVVNLVLVQWPSLVGVAVLITILINLGKTVGWVQDGAAPQWSAGLNLLGMVVLIVFKIYKPTLTVEAIDTQAGLIGSVLLVISGYALQIITSYLTHKSIAGVPGVGKSYSLTAKG
jgi:hypothetical protein